MIPVHCVVVDDEPAARELLREMRTAFPGISVVGEYADGASAARGILSAAPDVVFLDVRMPERDGFETLAALAGDRSPPVVFVTAHAEYALRAFDVCAIDYLLKPLDEERLARTIGRVREHLARRAGRPAHDAEALDGRASGRIPLRVGERTILVRLQSVTRVEADGKHVRVHTDDGVHVVRDSIGQLEQRLGTAGFLRVSRFALVNTGRIREVHPWFAGDHLLVMDDATQVFTTRGYRLAVRRLLGRD